MDSPVCRIYAASGVCVRNLIVFLSSALFGCGAILLGRRLAIKLTGPWAASYAATAVLLGTQLTYYATNMPSYSHAMDAFSGSAR